MSRVLPILFNTEMVRAILDDRKTATRRVIKKSQCTLLNKKETSELEREGLHAPFDGMTDAELIASTYKPPYQKGDILYVRETWAFMPCIGCDGDYARPGTGMNCYDTQAVEYDDGESISDGCFIYRSYFKKPWRINWRPSIHMPKQAARIWLRVIDVRVERLRDITEEQAVKEGLYKGWHRTKTSSWASTAKQAFMWVWDMTIKRSKISLYGWIANPWVWVIEFERCEKPEE